MYNSGWDGVSNPTLTDVRFEDNTASSKGGGLYNSGYHGESSPTLTRVTFSGNSAHYGGGLYNSGQSGISSPTLTDVTFSDNTAVIYGGGMVNDGQYGDSSPALTNVTFRNNTVTGAGAYGGAIYFDGDSGGPGSSGSLGATIVNGLFVDNGDQHIAYYGYDVITAPHFINCTFSGALSETVYVEGFLFSPPITFTNSILWGNNGDVTNNDAAVNVETSIVEEAAYGGSAGNTDTDPQFVDAAGGNLRVRQGSPAIDSGDNSAVPAGVTTDLDGFERFIGQVDMGAYESQYEEVCEFAWGEPMTLGRGQPITLTFDTAADLGTLSCITVTYIPASHPNATVPLQTGAFWTLGATPATATFTATLTIPYAGANIGSRLCRYPGGMGGAGWDCGDDTHTTFSSGAYITRTQVTQFSDWTIGNDVGPTRVSLAGIATRRTWVWLPALGLVALAALFTPRRSRRR
jgi:predicted outer membrane repeat protein